MHWKMQVYSAYSITVNTFSFLSLTAVERDVFPAVHCVIIYIHLTENEETSCLILGVVAPKILYIAIAMLYIYI